MKLLWEATDLTNARAILTESTTEVHCCDSTRDFIPSDIVFLKARRWTLENIFYFTESIISYENLILTCYKQMNLFLSPTILKLEELCRYFSWESWGCLHDVRGQVLRWACWPQWWGVRSGWRVSSKVTRLVNWAWLGLWYLHPASHWRRLVVVRLEIV